MFKKLLCAVALTSAVLAQDIAIVQPVAGTQVKAGSALTIQLESKASFTAVEEIAVIIGASSCLGGCPDPKSSGLGTVIYTGNFNAQWTDSTGNAHENVTVTAPNWFAGTGLISVAHFYLSGIRNVAEVQIASTTVDITGSSG